MGDVSVSDVSVSSWSLDRMADGGLDVDLSRLHVMAQTAAEEQCCDQCGDKHAQYIFHGRFSLKSGSRLGLERFLVPMPPSKLHPSAS